MSVSKIVCNLAALNDCPRPIALLFPISKLSFPIIQCYTHNIYNETEHPMHIRIYTGVIHQVCMFVCISIHLIYITYAYR